MIFGTIFFLVGIVAGSNNYINLLANSERENENLEIDKKNLKKKVNELSSLLKLK